MVVRFSIFQTPSRGMLALPCGNHCPSSRLLAFEVASVPRLRAKLRSFASSLAAYLRDTASRAANVVRTARREGMTARQKRALALASASFVLGIGFCVFMAWLIASIAADPSGFSQLVHDNLALACIAYALVNTLQVFAAFIPGEPLELVAGYLFGTWGGLAVVSAGLALGEAIVFIAVKRLGTRFVHLFVSQEKLDELAIFKDTRRLNTITFFMMFLPGTPKDIMTYIVGLTPMTLGTWMGISIPARVLSIVASTLVGAQAAEDNWAFAIGIFAITCVVSLFGVLYYLVISRQARQAALMDELGHREWVASGCKTNDAPRDSNVSPAEASPGPYGSAH